jgi:hypothetical protein
VHGNALRELVILGRRLKAGLVFVPCTLCGVPVDTATMPLNEQFCAACALASYAHSWN